MQPKASRGDRRVRLPRQSNLSSDLRGIKEVHNRKVQHLENAIRGLKAQAASPTQEIGNVRLTQPGFLGEKRTCKLMLSDFLGYDLPE